MINKYVVCWSELIIELSDELDFIDEFDNFSDAEICYKRVLKKDFVSKAYLTEIIQTNVN